MLFVTGAKRNFTQSVLGSMTLKPKREKKYIVQVVNLQKVKKKKMKSTLVVYIFIHLRFQLNIPKYGTNLLKYSEV